MKNLILLAATAAMGIAIPSVATGQGNGKGNGGGKSAAAKAEKYGKGVSNRGHSKSSGKGHAQVVPGNDAGRSIDERGAKDDTRSDDARSVRVNNSQAGRNGQFCPPGLANKENGCLPPGQAKKIAMGQQLSSKLRGFEMPANFRALYGDQSNYRYDGKGHIYRLDRNNRVSGLIPLLGGGFAVGQALPTGYDVYNVPSQYRNAFADSDAAHYRYGDNAIYQVDPKTQLIKGVAALLAKDNLAIGAPLPAGYDSYNLPLQARSQYPDTKENLYRYANGNIYQIDAKTRMIKTIVSALI